MNNTIENKIAVITGAKGGLGTFVTEAFLGAGATVVGVSRRIEQSDFPHSAFVAIPAELSSGEAARELIGRVMKRFGKVDIAVHLIGGFAGGKAVAETDDATWEKMLDLNYRSAIHIVRAVLPEMQKASSGRIIAIGSRAAAEPSALTAAYNASKAALVSLMRTIALENKATGVTANVILPGTMDTPANRAASPNADFSKWVNPRNVASLALWLASDAAGQVSGAVLPIYGQDV